MSGVAYYNGMPIYTLANSNGMLVNITLIGAIIQSLVVPDRCGDFRDVVLGFDYAAPYLNGTSPSFGAVVGRYANRIANHSFVLDNVTYVLDANDGNNTLHGGAFNYGRDLWQPNQITNNSVSLSLLSPDGDNGFPGAVNATVVYTLDNNSNTLTARFTATTTKPTVISLAQHTYFNLRGQGNGLILDQNLTVNGDYITPVDKQGIPNGTFLSVENTPWDFRNSTRIGARINEVTLPAPGGYDNNYVLFGNTGPQAKEKTTLGHVSDTVQFAAQLLDPSSGRVLDLWTNTPGLQVYTGNNLDGSVYGKGGVPYPKRSGIAMENQQFPNAPNQPNFPSTVLRPGEVYSQEVQYRFSTDGQAC